jgi:hypothetical protein
MALRRKRWPTCKRWPTWIVAAHFRRDEIGLDELTDLVAGSGDGLDGLPERVWDSPPRRPPARGPAA